MRVFLYSAIGIPVLIADAVLLQALPARMAGRFTGTQGLILLSGALVYLCLHFLLRKPERMYLWAHEVTHLLVAKLFLRNVHGFHITSRSGGKVVIDRTNVAIDLSPYAVPLYNVVALLPVTLFAGEPPMQGRSISARRRSCSRCTSAFPWRDSSTGSRTCGVAGGSSPLPWFCSF